jgi:hypothetical protein
MPASKAPKREDKGDQEIEVEEQAKSTSPVASSEGN